MKFVTSRDFRTNPNKIWKALSKEETMTITVNGKPVAMMLTTSPENYEDSLDTLRRVRAEKAVIAMHTHSVKKGLNKLSPSEIEAEIKASRK